MNTPLNFLRCDTGKIINTAQVLFFDIKSADNYITIDGKCQKIFAVTAHFAAGTERLSFHDTEAEADAELDRLYARLTGQADSEPLADIDITPVPPVITDLPLSPSPFDDCDPFNDESTEAAL